MIARIIFYCYSNSSVDVYRRKMTVIFSNGRLGIKKLLAFTVFLLTK